MSEKENVDERKNAHAVGVWHRLFIEVETLVFRQCLLFHRKYWKRRDLTKARLFKTKRKIRWLPRWACLASTNRMYSNIHMRKSVSQAVLYSHFSNKNYSCFLTLVPVSSPLLQHNW